MMKSMLLHTDDFELKSIIEHHIGETERHKQLLEGRLSALGAGKSDEETAEVARRNLADEKVMRDKIASSWDKVIDLTLQEEGLPA
ncbi:MAG: hypothetical protein ABR579_02760 [Actinomycetota bacterium]